MNRPLTLSQYRELKEELLNTKIKKFNFTQLEQVISYCNWLEWCHQSLQHPPLIEGNTIQCDDRDNVNDPIVVVATTINNLKM